MTRFASLVLACLVAALPSLAAAQKLEPFVLKSVSWYQNAAVLKTRLGADGAQGIAGYVEALDAQAREAFHGGARGEPASAAIVVAVKPGRQARFWIVQNGDAIDAARIERLTRALSKAEPIAVTGGPVAFALMFDAWGGGAPIVTRSSPFVIPMEWVEAQRDPRAQGPLPDGPLAVLWPDAPAKASR